MRCFKRKFMLLLIGVPVLAVAAEAGAGNTPPGFDAARWQQLLQTAVKTGTQLSVPDGNLYSLSRVVPQDPTKPHLADYFSVKGAAEPDGKVDLFEVSAVSEDWKINAAGNWDIDQWIYTVQVDGELEQVFHTHLVETPDHEVLQDDTEPNPGPQDPSMLKRWGEKLASWYAGLQS